MRSGSNRVRGQSTQVLKVIVTFYSYLDISLIISVALNTVEMLDFKAVETFLFITN